MSALTKKVQSFIKRFDLLEEDSGIVLGVSGGPDSICLLDIFCDLRKKYNLKIIVAHINYNLRGKASEKDRDFVKELAKKYGLKFALLEVDNMKMDDADLENKLRKIRYDFFEKIRREEKMNLIAVAHHKDDQAETVLMRILRGSGLQGLGSIRPKSGKIIRPLLRVSKKEIFDYLSENDLAYRLDESNKDTKFFRNKIRWELLPYLEKNYNPSVRNVLANLAESVADDYDFISQSASEKSKDILLMRDAGAQICVSKIKKEHPAMQRQILRQSIIGVKKNLTDIQSSAVEELLKIINSFKGKNQIKEFAGLKVVRKGDKLFIECL